MRKDRSFAKDLKAYNAVMSNIWQMLVTSIIGFVIGYFIDKYNGNDNNICLVIFGIIFTLIGLVNFITGIIKQNKILNKKEEKSENEEVNSN